MKADGGVTQRFGPHALSKTIFIVASAAFVVLSMAQIRQLAEYGELSAAADRLGRGEATPASFIHSHATGADLIVSNDTCLTDIVSAGATVLLADLDRTDADKDYDAWVAAFRRAQTYFEHAVACSPTNGNYWFRLAMVKQAIAERPEEITDLMARSIRWAPAENGVLLGRFALWNKVSDATLTSARRLVMHDLNALLAYGDRKEVADAVRSAGPLLRPYIVESVRLLPPDRIQSFADIGMDLRKIR